jgi:uncharacterized protein involved in outer membrane biogenesis
VTGALANTGTGTVNKTGAVNWRLAEAQTATGTQSRSGVPVPTAPTTTSTAAANVWVRNLRINGGELSYYDARSDYSDAFHDISVRVDMPAAGSQARTQPAEDLSHPAMAVKPEAVMRL